jgi:DNA polymerase-3 subunit gamma/tau
VQPVRLLQSGQREPLPGPHRIDAASQTGVEDVRDLRDKINFTPNQGKYKIYIIDEVHMFSNSAFNALLKTLEEPPPHAIFILATTEIHKIPPTVLSRCQRHEFRRVPVDDIVKQLQFIVKNEKLTAEPEALMLIARQSAGGMRDAISLLDQLASTGQTITLDLAQAVLGTATSQTLLNLIGAVLDRNPAAGMDAIHAALDSGTDPRVLARQVVDYLRALLLIQMGNAAQVDLSVEVRAQAEKHARAFSASDILRMVKAFNAAAADQRGGWQPSLPLELALAEVIETEVSAPSAPTASSPQEKKTSVTVSLPAPAETKPAKPAQEEPRVADSGITIGQVAKAWKQICATVKSDSMNLNALLNSSHPMDVKNSVLVIGFTSEILRGKADTPEQIEIIRKAVVQILGGELSVKCVVSNAKNSNRADVKADGMVAAALKHGGEIVDVQE